MEATVEAIELKKTCLRCGKLKPVGEFGASAKLPAGKFNTCYACRIANGSGRPGKQSSDAEDSAQAEAPQAVAENSVLAKEEHVPMPDRESCVHFRLSGDERIRRVFPAFFSSYEPSPNYERWEVCIKCGDVQLVTLYNPRSGNQVNEGPVRYNRVYVPPAVRELVAGFVPAPVALTFGNVTFDSGIEQPHVGAGPAPAVVVVNGSAELDPLFEDEVQEATLGAQEVIEGNDFVAVLGELVPPVVAEVAAAQPPDGSGETAPESEPEPEPAEAKPSRAERQSEREIRASIYLEYASSLSNAQSEVKRYELLLQSREEANKALREERDAAKEEALRAWALLKEREKDLNMQLEELEAKLEIMRLRYTNRALTTGLRRIRRDMRSIEAALELASEATR